VALNDGPDVAVARQERTTVLLGGGNQDAVSGGPHGDAAIAQASVDLPGPQVNSNPLGSRRSAGERGSRPFAGVTLEPLEHPVTTMPQVAGSCSPASKPAESVGLPRWSSERRRRGHDAWFLRPLSPSRERLA
jgi:hypothetical protein